MALHDQKFPLDTSWHEAEEKFPESTVCWDRDGGPAWLVDDVGSAVIAITATSLAVGCGTHKPFRWAIWNNLIRKWMFVG